MTLIVIHTVIHPTCIELFIFSGYITNELNREEI